MIVTSEPCGAKHLQVDEIWTFVRKKQAQLTENERNNPELGDQYVFVAIDAETKLIPTFLIGKRDGQTSLQFLMALQKQLAQDGFNSPRTAYSPTETRWN